MEHKTGKYLYCIIQGKVPRNRFALMGLENKETYLLNRGGLSCLISDTAVDHFPLWREHIVAHQRPIEEAMKCYDVLPFSFSNIANTEDDIKEKILKERSDEFEKLFQQFEGKTEMGLQAFWPDMQPIFKKIAASPELRRLKKSPRLTYKQQMAAGELVAKLLEKRKNEEGARIREAVKDLVGDSKELALFGENMVFHSACLIPKGREEEFVKRVEIVATDFPATKLRSSGPFPLYNFVNLKLHL